MVGGTDHGWSVVPTTASPGSAQNNLSVGSKNDLAVVPPLCRYYRPRSVVGLVSQTSLVALKLTWRWYRHHVGGTALGSTALARW